MFEKECDLARNYKHDTYQRRGYLVEHQRQRLASGHEHFFLIHDQGARCLPRCRHLIRMFIPLISADGKRRTTILTQTGINGPHTIWFKIVIQYRKS